MTFERVIILVAMQMEARAVARALGLRFESDVRARRDSVELHVVGVCARRMPALDTHGAVLMLVGLAGGLDPSLRTGDVVIDDPSHILPESLMPAIRRGSIHGVDRIIPDAAAKDALFRSTCALAVEMESPIVREVAARVGLPLVHIRSVVDTAADPLDPATANLIDPAGHVKALTALALLARHPALLPAMLRTKSKSTRALGELSEAVRAAVEVVLVT